ncbi:MAG: hypothetical protein EAZ92_13925 [Candidatus Kapaibacterium sp.]|nr:MAG: hypothetical protein EAZ92_13925 [Candidatus Kapabacteria bacterium]
MRQIQVVVIQGAMIQRAMIQRAMIQRAILHVLSVKRTYKGVSQHLRCIYDVSLRNSLPKRRKIVFRNRILLNYGIIPKPR